MGMTILNSAAAFAEGTSRPCAHDSVDRGPGLREANRLIWFVNLANNRGPDRRRSGPHPKRISSCYIKALRSSELGSRFGAYLQCRCPCNSRVSGGELNSWGY